MRIDAFSGMQIQDTGCHDVGFTVGGDEIEIVGRKGKYTEEEIESLSRK